jgi:hypothetical protein
LPGFKSFGVEAKHSDLAKCSTTKDHHYRYILKVFKEWLALASPPVEPALDVMQNASAKEDVFDSSPALTYEADGMETSTEGKPSMDKMLMLETPPESIFGQSVNSWLEEARYKEAEHFQRQLLEVTRLAYGSMDPRTLALKKNLGTIYFS